MRVRVFVESGFSSSPSPGPSPSPVRVSKYANNNLYFSEFHTLIFDASKVHTLWFGHKWINIGGEKMRVYLLVECRELNVEGEGKKSRVRVKSRG